MSDLEDLKKLHAQLVEMEAKGSEFLCNPKHAGWIQFTEGKDIVEDSKVGAFYRDRYKPVVQVMFEVQLLIEEIERMEVQDED
jgi:hypothetical protein